VDDWNSESFADMDHSGRHERKAVLDVDDLGVEIAYCPLNPPARTHGPRRLKEQEAFAKPGEFTYLIVVPGVDEYLVSVPPKELGLLLSGLVLPTPVLIVVVDHKDPQVVVLLEEAPSMPTECA